MSTEEEDGQRHYFHYLNSPSGSFLLVSPLEEVTTAIVFVHGFGGDAAGTWSQFQQVVDDHSTLRDAYLTADLYFLQYQAVWESINSSVDRFDSFMTNVVMNPDSEQFQVNLAPILAAEESWGDNPVSPDSDETSGSSTTLSALPAGHRYSHLVLVAHSEGGVVVRQALLNWYAENRAGVLLGGRVALFAPALFGYAPSGLLGVVANFPGVGRVLDGLARASPAYRDLQPSSPTDMLRPLRERTEALQEVAPVFCASILWGRRDRILKDDKYARDTSSYVDHLGHVDICKPTSTYDHPLTFVAGKLT